MMLAIYEFLSDERSTSQLYTGNFPMQRSPIVLELYTYLGMLLGGWIFLILIVVITKL